MIIADLLKKQTPTNNKKTEIATLQTTVCQDMNDAKNSTVLHTVFDDQDVLGITLSVRITFNSTIPDLDEHQNTPGRYPFTIQPCPGLGYQSCYSSYIFLLKDNNKVRRDSTTLGLKI